MNNKSLEPCPKKKKKKDPREGLLWPLFPLNLVTLKRLLQGVPITRVLLKWGQVLEEVATNCQTHIKVAEKFK